MAKFTEDFIAKLQVPEGKSDIQVFDDELPGFGCRKFASGAASYFVKFNVGAQQRRKALGRPVKGNLKPMRLEASGVLAKARLGIDVVAQAKAAGKPIVTLGSLVPPYLKARETELREKSHVETTRYLTKTWKPLHGYAVDAIGRRDIVAIIDGMEAKTAADRARAALSAFYAWCVERSYVDVNPTMNIATRAQGGGRNRVLSEPELVLIWKACGDDDYGRIVRLLILTGQRRQEIGGLRWAELESAERQIDLPERRTKNNLPHIIPLSDEALALIDPVPRGERELVFGAGANGFMGWAEGKQALDARIAAKGKPLAPWVIHDLRRSFVTHIEDNGFSLPHVTEAIINHVSGKAKAGTAGIYNKAVYLRERIQALDMWAAHVAALVAGGTGRVVPLRRLAAS